VKDSDNHLNDHDKPHVVGASLKEVRELLIEVQQRGRVAVGSVEKHHYSNKGRIQMMMMSEQTRGKE